MLRVLITSKRDSKSSLWSACSRPTRNIDVLRFPGRDWAPKLVQHHMQRREVVQVIERAVDDFILTLRRHGGRGNRVAPAQNVYGYVRRPRALCVCVHLRVGSRDGSRSRFPL